MQSFLSFLLEDKAERSKELAHKLLDRISRYHQYHSIDSSWDMTNLHHKDLPKEGKNLDSRFARAKERDVPVHKIYADQPGVGKSSVHRKIDGDEHNDPPIPHIYHHKANDTYHVYDGNHRVLAHKLLRKKTIRAKVVEI